MERNVYLAGDQPSVIDFMSGYTQTGSVPSTDWQIVIIDCLFMIFVVLGRSVGCVRSVVGWIETSFVSR